MQNHLKHRHSKRWQLTFLNFLALQQKGLRRVGYVALHPSFIGPTASASLAALQARTCIPVPISQAETWLQGSKNWSGRCSCSV